MDAFSSPCDADDNAFYEQLTRQILMLTDEDDDDTTTYLRKPVVHGYVGSKRPEPMEYYSSWSETGRCSVPSWMESLWAKGGGGGGGGGGGTGVFIPAARNGGKKSGRRRYNNDKARRNNDRGRMYSVVNGQKIHG